MMDTVAHDTLTRVRVYLTRTEPFLAHEDRHRPEAQMLRHGHFDALRIVQRAQNAVYMAWWESLTPEEQQHIDAMIHGVITEVIAEEGRG